MIQRTAWVSALKALPTNELLTFTKELSEEWTLRPKSLPQSGLGMMKLKDSACNEDFYLGEFPMSSAWLEVTTPAGLKAEGAAHVMDDNVEIAEALAVCDAVLSSELPGWKQVYKMVEQGLSIRENTNRERKMMLAHTRVNFSLLDNVGDDNNEN
ncbi:MAG: phosphonate C-P lyase system protein PhnG [Woeseiaceae bacterium]